MSLLFQRVHLLLLLYVVNCFIGVGNASWVDPDTPVAHRSTLPLTETDTREYRLVFSDEFEQDGRSFHDGSDPRWTAINKNDYTNAALHFYSADNARTTNGVLNITTEQKENTYKAFDEDKKEYYVDKKHVQSGMLQSWNKFCFVGGVVEFSAKLPGDPKVGGLWPALWMLGNLARATYVGSSDFVWPYSYNKCDRANRKSQEINACAQVNHYGLASFTGRGSPEIDVLEAMQGDPGKLPSTFIQRPYQSTSLQVAPGVEIDRPMLGHRPHKGHWYDDTEYSPKNISDLNPFFYGVKLEHIGNGLTYQSDAISANTQLNLTNYKKQHIYRVEWEPPFQNGTGGYIRWYNDGELVYAIRGSSLDIMQTEIPSEPMYLIMNTAVASSWGFPAPCPDGCKCKCYECGNPACTCSLPAGYCDNFPASFEIDYIRVYQAVDEPSHIVGCSPEHRPTEQFIEGHAKLYSSEGEKEPLQPVIPGGGLCQKNSDCGLVNRMGACTKKGNCVCGRNFTGPHCLAHAAFYDYDTRIHAEKFSLSEMMFPKSMILVSFLLAVGFFLSMLGTMNSKTNQRKYQPVGDVRSSSANGGALSQGDTISSYQDSAAVHYSMPGLHKKDATYVVIDGRMVDDR